MQIAMIGLGRMGGNMTQRLLEGGHDVVVFDLNNDAREEAEKLGATSVTTLEELPNVMAGPRVVWIMVPAGGPTEATIQHLKDILEPGDVIIDGGNSNFRDSIERGRELEALGFGFIDAGVSGGVWGLREGYCLMVGGAAEHVEKAMPAFETLAPENGFGHMGGVGSGHFVKMVHNGIEYGMMAAFAEGFELMESMNDWDLDLGQISELWRHGSVVRSWLLDLLSNALGDPETFSQIKGYVEDSGEGRWTVEEAINQSVPLPVITASLFARFTSRQDESYAAKVTAALRNQFGGHSMALAGGGQTGPTKTPVAGAESPEVAMENPVDGASS